MAHPNRRQSAAAISSNRAAIGADGLPMWSASRATFSLRKPPAGPACIARSVGSQAPLVRTEGTAPPTIVRIHRHAISMAQSSTRNLQHVVIHAQSIHNHQPAMPVPAQVSTPLAQCPSSSPNPCQSIRSQIKEITTINEVMCPQDLLANKA